MSDVDYRHEANEWARFANALRVENATLRQKLARAVRLLHMLDNQDAHHPDVAEFLDEVDAGDKP